MNRQSRRSDHRSQHHGLIRYWVAAFVPALCGALMFVGCAMNPVSGLPEVTLVSTEQEKKLGAEEAEKVKQEMGLIESETLSPYLNRLGDRLAQQSPRQDVSYQFAIIDMPEPNAFALPGGYVYVSRGLLALVNSEDELAGVVGHEIGHVAARHSVQKISKQGPFAVLTNLVAGITGLVSPFVGRIVGGIGDFAQSLVFSPYSRSQETEADRVGQEMAARAGWDPAGLSTFLNTLERDQTLHEKEHRRPSFFDSHPATPERVAKTAAHAKQITRVNREPISPSHDAFLAQLDGLVVGQRAANGLFQGQMFLHPDFDFLVQFPEQWQLSNSPQKVAAAAPDGEAAVVLGAVAKGDDPLEGARVAGQAAKADIVSKTQTIRIGDLPAAHTRIHADGKIMMDLTWIAHRGLVYQIAGLASTKRFEALEPTFTAVAQSFRPLSQRSGMELRKSASVW
jgi:predicted Zn-dependent protease